MEQPECLIIGCGGANKKKKKMFFSNVYVLGES